MKYSLVFVTIFSLGMLSCGEGRKKNTTSGPLIEVSDASSQYKRKGGDVIEDIYRDHVKNNKELQELENKIENLAQDRSDSLDGFVKFDEQVSAYYKLADYRVKSLDDSVLQAKMKLLIENSLAKYDADISKHRQLIVAIDKKTVKLDDLHNVLKLVRTLPIIEKYQKDQKPSTKPLERYSADMDKVVAVLDSLVRN